MTASIDRDLERQVHDMVDAYLARKAAEKTGYRFKRDRPRLGAVDPGPARLGPRGRDPGADPTRR